MYVCVYVDMYIEYGLDATTMYVHISRELSVYLLHLCNPGTTTGSTRLAPIVYTQIDAVGGLGLVLA